MDTNKLRYFRTVVECGSLRQASSILNISPGALSKALKIFSEEVGLTLFESYGRGVQITEQGKLLYEKSNRLIHELDVLKRNLHREKSEEIKLGSYEVFSTLVLAQFIHAEKLENIAMEELGPQVIEQALLERSIDYGVTMIPYPRPELDHMKVGSLRMKTYCKNSGRFKDKSFNELPYVVPTTHLGENPHSHTAIDGWPEAFKRKVVHRCHMLQSGLELASLDEAVVYCPDFVVKFYNQKLKRAFQLEEHSIKKGNQTAGIYLVKRKETPENSFTKKLARFFRAHKELT